MFKPELWQSHDGYRTIVTQIGRRLSRNNPKYFFDSYDEKCQKLKLPTPEGVMNIENSIL